MKYTTTRWELLEDTSQSGCSLFKCTVCGRVSKTPDKTCKTVEDPNEKKHLCSRYDGVKYYRYYLPSVKGEGWATILIGSNGEFMALSDYGNYGYWWTNMGVEDAREFFLKCAEEWEYFATKLAEGRKVYDGTETLLRVKESIDEIEEDDPERASSEEELLELYDIEDDEQDFNRWLDATSLEDAWQHRALTFPTDVMNFVKKVLGGERFQEMLCKDLEKKEKATCLENSSS